jgi:hypothetical protein
MEHAAMLDSISAITLATHDMARAVRFYRMLGFVIVHGGEEAAFTSFWAGRSYLNLVAQPAERAWSWWGRLLPFRRRCAPRERLATVRTRHRVTPNGASGSST